MSSIPTDHELAAAARDGDDAALRLLLERHLPAVYTFCARFIGNPEDAQDAAQEAFLKAWRNLARFDLERSFRTWVLAIARNASIDLMRKRRPLAFSQFAAETASAFEETIADPEPLPEEVFARATLAEDVRAALAHLPPRSRAILSMRYEEELSFEEIAQVMDMPANTVRSTHRRALSALRGYFQEKPGMP